MLQVIPGHAIAAVRELKSSLWDTAGGKGAEIRPKPMHSRRAPPPVDYPCEVISCNAMKNHPTLEGKGKHEGRRAAEA